VLQALPFLARRPHPPTLVLYGDVPLIGAATLSV
jgi:bifunctional N-acetylglucosamine-1-phosphate-uridyltransferase/glucosamine-1-phosphate-acetyltransferase GlmU-like protein